MKNIADYWECRGEFEEDREEFRGGKNNGGRYHGKGEGSMEKEKVERNGITHERIGYGGMGQEMMLNDKK